MRLMDTWILGSISLYLLVGACWVPVVFMQMRMRDMAGKALREGAPFRRPTGDTSGAGSG